MSEAKPFEFEKALKELEAITAWFESSDVDLDQGIAKFERGMELADQLKTHLTAVENRIEKIRERFSAAKAEESAPDESSSGESISAESAVAPDQTDLFGA